MKAFSLQKLPGSLRYWTPVSILNNGGPALYGTSSIAEPDDQPTRRQPHNRAHRECTLTSKVWITAFLTGEEAVIAERENIFQSLKTTFQDIVAPWCARGEVRMESLEGTIRAQFEAQRNQSDAQFTAIMAVSSKSRAKTEL